MVVLRKHGQGSWWGEAAPARAGAGQRSPASTTGVMATAAGIAAGMGVLEARVTTGEADDGGASGTLVGRTAGGGVVIGAEPE